LEIRGFGTWHAGRLLNERIITRRGWDSHHSGAN
jgi:hypothetical protein